MNEQIYFSSNLIFLRNWQKISQKKLAEDLRFTRAKLAALEGGHSRPYAEDALLISEKFRISVDALLKIDLSKLGTLKLRDLMAGNDIYTKGSNIRVLAITVNKDNNENLEFVPVNAKAGYRSGFSDPEYIAELPRFSFPDLPGGTKRMFPITGDSMQPIPDGSQIITTYVEDWTSLKKETACILILNGTQDFVFKLATWQEDKSFLLRSLNKAYQPYTVPVEEVMEVWKFYAYTSKLLPEEIADQDMIYKLVKEIGQDVKTLTAAGKRKV